VPSPILALIQDHNKLWSCNIPDTPIHNCKKHQSIKDYGPAANQFMQLNVIHRPQRDRALQQKPCTGRLQNNLHRQRKWVGKGKDQSSAEADQVAT